MYATGLLIFAAAIQISDQFLIFLAMNSKKTNTRNHLACLTLFLAIFVTLSQSHAEQTQPASSEHQFPYRTQQWKSYQTQFLGTKLKVTTLIAVTGVLCLIAASISSAGGIGGGGLYIPILTIVAGLELKTATSFSAFMVTGGSIANVIYHMLGTGSKLGGKNCIDYDIALLSEPCMLLGVSIGVICNLVFPEWLVTILFVVFLAWCTSKTCKNGILHWKLESENVNRDDSGTLENGLVKDETCNGCEGLKSSEEPLLNAEEESNKLRFPWMKLGILILVWFSFFLLYLFRGNRYGQGIIAMKPCGVGYWILSSLQIPLAVTFTVWIWIQCRRESTQHEVSNQQDIEELTSGGPSIKRIFPFMALMAGLLGGLFGIGGGMVISPLLLHIGIAPEVTAATCSFMVFFSSTMSAFQYLLLGMEQTETALIFAIICFVGSFLGLLVVQKAIQEYGRASLIVFSVGIVMALSTVLITCYSALNVWRDYISGNYMGFKMPC